MGEVMGVQLANLRMLVALNLTSQEEGKDLAEGDVNFDGHVLVPDLFLPTDKKSLLRGRREVLERIQKCYLPQIIGETDSQIRCLVPDY